MGSYLVISQISKDRSQSQKQISDFYNQTDAGKIDNDIIFKAVPFEVIPCTITYNKDAINYRTLDGNSASLNKEREWIYRPAITSMITNRKLKMIPTMNARLTPESTTGP